MNTAMRPHGADRFERMLAVAAVILLIAMLAAIARGRAHWGEATVPVWLHLATIGIALAVTPAVLLRQRGTRSHRAVGWVWATAMFATAIISFMIRQSGNGGLSLIHILSGMTVVLVPMIVISARRHDIRRHRRMVRGTVLGALLIAGFFTFPFGRMMGRWLFG